MYEARLLPVYGYCSITGVKDLSFLKLILVKFVVRQHLILYMPHNYTAKCMMLPLIFVNKYCKQ